MKTLWFIINDNNDLLDFFNDIEFPNDIKPKSEIKMKSEIKPNSEIKEKTLKVKIELEMDEGISTQGLRSPFSTIPTQEILQTFLLPSLNRKLNNLSS